MTTGWIFLVAGIDDIGGWDGLDLYARLTSLPRDNE